MMPFKSLFRGHKRGKQTTKRGVHFLGEHHSEASEEPPDGSYSILDQFQHMKLHKQDVKGRNLKNHTRDHGARKSSHWDLPQPPLNRASSDPLPVSSDDLKRNVHGVRRVRKSSSLVASLDSSEYQLHDRRIKDIVKLENYIKYMQQSAEDEEACHMASRLCCAQVLKTLYLRHEQQYVNYLQHSRSPGSLFSPPLYTNLGKHSDICDTCMTPLQEDLESLSTADNEGIDYHEDRDLYSMLKKPTTMTSSGSSSSFCRQTRYRVPVAPRRHGHRVSLSLTPHVFSSEMTRPSSLLFEDEDFGGSHCSLDRILGDSQLPKSTGLSEQTRGCGSNWSTTSFSTNAVFPTNYEIY